MTKSLKHAGLVLCFLMAAFSAPAFAYDIGSFAYPDGPGSVAGWSYTALDADDYYEDFALEAAAFSTLYLDGTQVYFAADENWGDPGDYIYAQASVQGSGAGEYEVVGDHWEYTVWGWLPLGPTSYWIEANPDTISLSPLQYFDDGGGPASFSVTVSNGYYVTYDWGMSVPYGAGAAGGITGGTTASITAAGSWYPYPDTPCAPLISTYDISVLVTFDDGVYVWGADSLGVGVTWMPGGITDPAQLQITGGPTIGRRDDGTGLWRVIGQGTLARQIPTAQVFVSPYSQFYGKAAAHEAVHVSQFQAGGLFGGFLLVSDFYDAIKNLTDTTDTGLNAQLSAVMQAMEYNFVHFQYRPLIPQAEQQAYATSDSISPLYIYQSQCVGYY